MPNRSFSPLLALVASLALLLGTACAPQGAAPAQPAAQPAPAQPAPGSAPTVAAAPPAAPAAPPAQPAPPAKTVKVGWVKVLQWAHWYDMPRYLDPSVKVEFNEFKNSNEVLVALQSGSIDMGTIGYSHMAGILAKDVDTLQFVAGVSSGASRFIAAKDAPINSWDDLKGKRIGGSRGSTQYMQAVVAMAKHGIDVNKDVQFTHLAGMADMQAALQKGEIDAAMGWDPNASEAILAGYARDIPAIKETLYSDSFKISSGIAARRAFLQESPDAVQKVIDAYYKSYQKITGDQNYWTDMFSKVSGIDKPILDLAAPNSYPEFAMDQKEIKLVGDLLAEQKVIEKNVTDQLLNTLNYSFIEKASGKAKTELGG